MKKRILAFFTAFFVLISSVSFAAKKDLKEAYSRDIRIGLKNMMTTSLKVTFNGNYRAGSDSVNSGTSIVLCQKNGKIIFNNIEYSEITFVPVSNSSTITLEYGTKKYHYLGSMTFKALTDGNILPVNTLDIESYLKGVIGYEMGNYYPIEALKAQAVAARNYALANIGKYDSQGYDLTDGTSDQMYRGYNSEYKNVIRAVDETRGVVLVYNDSLASVFYSASNGGYVESTKNVWVADIPYLQAKEDSFDVTKWPGGDKKFTSSEIDSKLKSKGILSEGDKFIRLNIDTIQRNESTRVSSIEIVYQDALGTEKIKAIKKESTRTFLSLQSSLYTVTYDEATDTYTFSGMGNGHGVGLSQIGARNRANAGQKYDEILKFYCSGTELKNIGDIVESFSISRYEAYIGDTISFNVNTLPSSNRLYKYTVENNGQIVYTRDYSNNPNAEYKVDRSGYFTVHFYSKSQSSSMEYEEHKTLNFSVIDILQISQVSIIDEPYTVNKPLTINVEINGGAAAGVEYSFETTIGPRVFDIVKSDSPSFTFIPKEAGEYTLFVQVRDKANNKGYNDMETLNINVKGEEKPSEPVQKVLYSITRNLKIEMSGSDVKTLQSVLKTLGYFKYPSLTTYFGTVTDTAVRTFQRENGLTQNGVVDSKTADAINKALVAKSGASSSTPKAPAVKASRTLKLGMSGNDVGQLQSALEKLGYYKYGKITSYFGTVTRDALIAFQKANGLSQTGYADSAVINKINEKLK